MSDPLPRPPREAVGDAGAETAVEGEAPAALPADRIFLTGYVREVEIGAYPEEQGVTQRLRLDVDLEVTRNTAHVDDRVGRVINYDTLVSAIEDLATGPRITLLETFAERLAWRVLADPRARRVRVRIEKLDRLPHGARLGCEIVRTRGPEGDDDKVRALAAEGKQGEGK